MSGRVNQCWCGEIFDTSEQVMEHLAKKFFPEPTATAIDDEGCDDLLSWGEHGNE